MWPEQNLTEAFVVRRNGTGCILPASSSTIVPRMPNRWRAGSKAACPSRRSMRSRLHVWRLRQTRTPRAGLRVLAEAGTHLII
jgi:hypothetical protein